MFNLFRKYGSVLFLVMAIAIIADYVWLWVTLEFAARRSEEYAVFGDTMYYDFYARVPLLLVIPALASSALFYWGYLRTGTVIGCLTALWSLYFIVQSIGGQ
jgi:hypothetical protein